VISIVARCFPVGLLPRIDIPLLCLPQ